MSKWMLVVCCLALGMAAVATADDSYYQVYNYGSGALYGPVDDPYSGATPSGMRFGDAGQVSGETGGPGVCQNCFGVRPHPCDSCWGGPCMDWKLIGWYSHWGHKGCWGDKHCRKRCCASVGGDCESGNCESSGDGDNSCVTCR